MNWTEYGVLLADELAAPAASRAAAWDYDGGPGRIVVFREVRLTRIPRSGDAIVELGDWHVDKRGRAA